MPGFSDAMIFYYLHFRTYCHATEDEEKVEKALKFLCGDVKLRKTKTKGHHGNPITILEARLERRTEIEGFWERFKASNVVSDIDLNEKVDDDCSFYLRFDKQNAFNEEFKVVSHDDVIVLRAKLKVFPATKGCAIKELKSYFK